jgi:hypothetical protein
MRRNKFDSDYWDKYTDTEECDRLRDDIMLQQQLEEYEKLSQILPQGNAGELHLMHNMDLQQAPILGSAG